MSAILDAIHSMGIWQYLFYDHPAAENLMKNTQFISCERSAEKRPIEESSSTTEVEEWHSHFCAELKRCFYRPQSINFEDYEHRRGLYQYVGIKSFCINMLNNYEREIDEISRMDVHHNAVNVFILKNHSLLKNELSRLAVKYAPIEQAFTEFMQELRQNADELFSLLSLFYSTNTFYEHLPDFERLQAEFEQMQDNLSLLLVNVEGDLEILKKKQDLIKNWYLVRPALEEMAHGRLAMSSNMLEWHQTASFSHQRLRPGCLRFPDLISNGYVYCDRAAHYPRAFALVDHFYNNFIRILDINYHYLRAFRKALNVPLKEISIIFEKIADSKKKIEAVI